LSARSAEHYDGRLANHRKHDQPGAGSRRKPAPPPWLRAGVRSWRRGRHQSLRPTGLIIGLSKNALPYKTLLLRGKSICGTAATIAVQETILLSSIGVSWLASAVAAQETIFLSSIRGSYYSIFDSLPGKARRAAITTNKALHFNHLRLKHSGFDRFPDRFVFHQFQIFLLLQRG